jgi:WD40-like Beta Propeller Repeat
MTVSRRIGIRPAVWVALLLLILVLVGCGSPEEPVSFLTVDTDPDWSPDGQLIAFASSRWLGGLFVIRPDGTGLRQLFRGNASNPRLVTRRQMDRVPGLQRHLPDWEAWGPTETHPPGHTILASRMGAR